MKYTNEETAKVSPNGSIRDIIKELNKNIMANRELTALLQDRTSSIRVDKPLAENSIQEGHPLCLSEIETMIWDCNESVQRNSKEIVYIIETLRL